MAKSYTYKPKRAAKGASDGTRRKIAVGFYPDLFKQISAAAQASGRSFREQVNVLCERGLRGEH